MAYKKVLAVHPVHDPVNALDPVVDIARAHQAQLDVLILNLAGMPVIAMAQDPKYDWSGTFGDLLLETEQRDKDVRAYLDNTHLPYTVQSQCIPLGMVDNVVGDASLCTDLVIFNSGFSSLVNGLAGQALEGALLDAGKPVLIVNNNNLVTLDNPDTVVIAWDSVPQAARAVQAGIPILQQAKKVDLLQIGANDSVEESVGNTAGIKSWLELHGITPVVRIVSQDGQFVSHALSAYLDAHPCDLLIMGAYGHSRVSEKLFAGTTHVALTELEMPKLIAH